MSKQTAVDRYRLESQKLMIKAIREEISNEEWRLLENKLGEEAKAMEREQIVEAYQAGDGGAYNLQDTKLWGQEFYNEKYGGNNDN
jgi:hypothetical protein